MKRALVVLTGGAFATLAFEESYAAHPLPGIAIAAVYAVISVVGFDRVNSRPRGQRWSLAAAYVLIQLTVGFAMFSLAGAGVGATLLLMVLVSQSVQLLPLPAAAAVTAVVPLVHVGMDWGDGLRNGLGMLAAALFTAVVTELLQREQSARAKLMKANEQLRGYAAQAEELATIRERNRVARDIHDGLGHHLTVVQMQVQAARAVLTSDPTRADAVLAKAQQQAAEALADVRQSVRALREPRSIPPLRTSLEALAAQTSAAGLPTELDVCGAARSLPAEAAESLFRTAQEGLTNVRKHAGATRARLVLDYRDTATVRLEVRDDGRGADEPVTAGYGLVGLRERAALHGGRVDFTATPGQGMTLWIEVPG